jgi:hypothetical protein
MLNFVVDFRYRTLAFRGACGEPPRQESRVLSLQSTLLENQHCTLTEPKKTTQFNKKSNRFFMKFSQLLSFLTYENKCLFPLLCLSTELDHN